MSMQVTNLYAVSSRYGTPDDFKRLVDEAHGYYWIANPPFFGFSLNVEYSPYQFFFFYHNCFYTVAFFY